MNGPRMLLDPARLGLAAENLEKDLSKRIVGQEDAVHQIVDMYQTFLAGMSTPGRPVGTLLFLGPTGSGKTHTVEALAESLMGDPLAVLKIDCAEFQHSHEIAKLIGSPPGYLGHRETHPLLSQEALNQFHTETLKLSFVLFDEIEKASDALWNLLLGILDKATLTLGDNRRVDFSRAMIFLTSNLGAADMNAILQPKLGFTAGQAVALDDSTTGRLARSGLEAARRRFSPEFMNRIDRTVVFRPLGAAELRLVLDLEIEAVQQRLEHSPEAPAVEFSVTESAREFLLREGTDARYGARHLKRALERRLVHPLSSLIATGQLQPRDLLVVDVDPTQQRLLFFKEYREPVVAVAAA
jgi:ATP-dependent Clp protease ATP-binding subunit ClpB